MACTLLAVLYCKFALYERVAEWLAHCFLCCIVSLLCMSEWLSGLYIAYCAVL